MSDTRRDASDEHSTIVYSDSSDYRAHEDDVAEVRAWYHKHSGSTRIKDDQTRSTSSTADVYQQLSCIPELASVSTPQPSRGIYLTEANKPNRQKIPRSKSESRLVDDENLLLDKTERSLVNSRR